MSIKCLSIDDKEEWNQIIKSFKNYDVYYLNEYVRAFQIHGDGTPELIFFNNSNFRAANVVMKRDINAFLYSKNIYLDESIYDYSTPYGYGGFLLEGNICEQNLSILKKEYEEFCKNHHIVTEFVRFHPLLDNQRMLNGIYDIKELSETISIPLNDRKFIWNNLVGKNRNVIRKAIKSGVKIYIGHSEKLYDDFIEMYNTTMKKDEAKEYYYFGKEFYNSLLNDLKYHSLIFYAVLNDEIIAMSIIMFCNENMHYHLSASKKEYLTYAPTNLLLYEAACWGVENGYKKFHLGGGLGSRQDSLYKFKKSFVKEYQSTIFSIGKKIFDQEKYNKLCSLVGTNSEMEFFPRYRNGE